MKTADPYLPAAKAAVEAFKANKLAPDAAMTAIWEAMRKAGKEGLNLSPYVKLTESVTFGETEPDADKDAAIAATWSRDGFD